MYRLPHQKIALVLVDVRSAHNVGTIWRTADACVVSELLLVGITPHPEVPKDPRAGHVVARHEREIAKCALGAEKTVPFRYFECFDAALSYLSLGGYQCFAVECNRQKSIELFTARFTSPTALFVGSETEGLSQGQCDKLSEILEIPMYGTKASLNVAIAASIALYAVRNNIT